MEEKLKPAGYYQEPVSGVEAGLPSRNPKRLCISATKKFFTQQEVVNDALLSPL